MNLTGSLVRVFPLGMVTALWAGLAAGASSAAWMHAQTPAPDDPALRTAVERFFAAQEAEDIQAYLGLWSRTAQRPQASQLKYVFDSGDDKFSGVAIVRLIPDGDRVRARVAAHRQRSVVRSGGLPPMIVESDMAISLTYVKEDGDWKLVREAPAADDLAEALLRASTPDARRQLLDGEPDLVGDSLISALTSRGSMAVQVRQDYATAAAIFERAREVARLAGNTKAEGEALQNIANALYFQRSYEAALDRYNERLELARARTDDEGVAAGLGGIATVRYTYAEYQTALKMYREALAIQERLADLPGAATTLISTGNILYLQGDYEGAIADYRRSRDLHHQLALTDGEARALEGLGRVFIAQGNLAAALEAFRGVLAEGVARNDRRGQAAALQHIGEIHFRLANLDTARASFDASRGHYETLGDQPNVGRLWQAIALTDLVASRFAPAEQEYRKSHSICSAASDAECVAHAIVGLAFALSAQEKFAEAAASYQQAIAAFSALGHSEEAARAEVGLSQAWLGKGDLDAAKDAAARARQYAVGAGNDDVLWRALVADARVLRRKGDRAAATAAAQAAVAAVEVLQRTADEHPGRSMPAECAMAFASLVVLHAERGDAAAAFAAAERMRAVSLRATLASHERDISRGMTADERTRERDDTAQVISLDAQLARQRSLPKPDTTRVDELQRQLADAVAKRGEARQRLFERLPELATWRGLATVSGSDLRDVLNAVPGSLLLQFVVDADDLVVMTASLADHQVAMAAWTVPITRHRLAERVARAVQPSVLRDAAEWNKGSAEIVSLLPQAVVDALQRARAITIIPDGPLWRVPFEALTLKSSYLSDAATVTYAGSVAALDRRLQSARNETSDADVLASRRPALRVVAVAAPELAPSIRDLALQTAPGWTLRSSDTAIDEARRATAVYSRGDPASVVITGKDATESRVRAALMDGDVLQVGAPFHINAASPLFSSILLATPAAAQDDSADDGVLETREIMNMNVPARTLLLSDGEATSMRDALAATGVIEWAWLAADVPSLVLNRWTADETAPELLAAFHRKLLSGMSPGEALRVARASVRARADTSAPYYWAGWMAIGR